MQEEKALEGIMPSRAWCGKQDLNSMSFSSYAIYCAMQFLQSTIYSILCYLVQRRKAVSEAVKGILKGRNSSFLGFHEMY